MRRMQTTLTGLKLIYLKIFLKEFIKWADGKDDEQKKDGADKSTDGASQTRQSVRWSSKATRARSTRGSSDASWQSCAHLKAEAECAALKSKINL